MRIAVLVLLLLIRLHAADTVLNVSQDLVPLGIAAKNMEPNRPDLDSRPLLEAAVVYAHKQGIPLLQADSGDYYFLTMRNRMTHVLLDQALNLTIDFQNSDLYFQQANRSALWCSSCAGVVLRNFTVDYLQLPFTQAVVSAVDTTARTLHYRTTAGYPSPVDFNTPRTPDGSDDIEIFLFRDGVPLLETGRIAGVLPATSDTITLGSPGSPWARPAALAAIRPGDTILYTDRGGPHTIHFTDSENCTVRNVSIYSSGSMALTIPNSTGMTIDQVQVIPRPGTTRLMSANADGVHATFAGANNVFTNNIVRRTGDDALAFDAPWVATVSRAAQGTSLVVARYATQDIPVGAELAFLNPQTGVVVGSAKVAAQNPPHAQQRFTNLESITLTLDKAVPGVAAGFGVFNMDPATHGGGSVIAHNLIQEGIFTRGIWLSGMMDMTVHDNLVQRTSKPGIFLQQVNATGVQEGPSSNITIHNNVVDRAIAYGGPSIGPIVAAASIHTVAENDDAAQVTGASHLNIVVNGNRVSNSSRSAIRLENVDGGEVTNNIVQGYGLAPNTNVYIIPSCCQTLAQYIADFSKPLLLTSTVSVLMTSNAVDEEGLLEVGSAASGVPKVAPGSVAAVTGVKLGGVVSVTLTDSAGALFEVPVLTAAETRVTFVVPGNAALGIASVRAAGQSGGVLIGATAPALFPDSIRIVDRQVIIQGTGLRGYSDRANVVARFGAKLVDVAIYPEDNGIDTVELLLPADASLNGPIILTVDGQTANVVTISS